MQTIDEIKANLERAKKCDAKQQIDACWCSDDCPMCELRTIKTVNQIEHELFRAIASDIPFDRLREICAAEQDKRCVVLPCKVGDKVYVIAHCEDVVIRTAGYLKRPFQVTGLKKKRLYVFSSQTLTLNVTYPISAKPYSSLAKKPKPH